MDAGSLIRRAVPVLAQYGHADQGILRAWLVRAGLSKEDALTAMRFVPLAFARELLKGMGVALADTYIRISADGQQKKEQLLNDEPVFRGAVYLAPIIASEIGMDAFSAICMQSSEFQAINKALNAGSKREDLVAGPPVVMLNEGEKLDQPKRPWWKFL